MTHRSLTDIDHNTVVGKCSDNAHAHDTCQTDQIRSKAAEIIGAVLEHRSNVIIHQCLRKRGPDYCRDGSDQDTDNNKYKRIFIIMEHIPDDTIYKLCSCIDPAS